MLQPERVGLRTTLDLAEVGYRAFAGHVAPATREPWPGAPSFDQLPVRIREAWEAAAKALVDATLQDLARAQMVDEEREARGDPPCRVCGCDDSHACVGGCGWVDVDLCSACESAAAPLIVVPDAATVREVLR